MKKGIEIIDILCKAGAHPEESKYPPTRCFYYDQRSALDHAKTIIDSKRRQDIIKELSIYI